ERSHQEAGGIGREGRQERRGIVSGREEQRGEERCQRGVEIEVVPFEYGAERGGEDDATFVARHSLDLATGQRQRRHVMPLGFCRAGEYPDFGTLYRPC